MKRLREELGCVYTLDELENSKIFSDAKEAFAFVLMSCFDTVHFYSLFIYHRVQTAFGTVFTKRFICFFFKRRCGNRAVRLQSDPYRTGAVGP